MTKSAISVVDLIRMIRYCLHDTTELGLKVRRGSIVDFEDNKYVFVCFGEWQMYSGKKCLILSALDGTGDKIQAWSGLRRAFLGHRDIPLTNVNFPSKYTALAPDVMIHVIRF